MEIQKNQPWILWSFVLALNLIGFAGLYFLKKHGIDIYALHSNQ
tara:strand:- start:238 stop:369 length:132 start_codon:yes stop_codon:yes gene_type:complete